MTDPEGVELLYKTFGGYCHWMIRKRPENARPLLQWRVHGENAIETIKQLLPFLRVKKRVAEVVLEYLEHIHDPAAKIGKGYPMSEAELWYREETREKVRALNTRRRVVEGDPIR